MTRNRWPSAPTLIQLAEQRGLFDAVATPPPPAERALDALLASASLAALHLTLDVLVHHQYTTDVPWPLLLRRTAAAWLVFLPLVYALRPHGTDANADAATRPLRRLLRQALFFAVSVAAGCHLIHISNTAGYLATMKRAPPLGCLWLWAVVELDLPAAVLSLACVGLFLWQSGYSIK